MGSRWAEDDLQRWQAALGQWVRVADRPLLQAALNAKAEGEIAEELQTWTETSPSAWPSDATLDEPAADDGPG